MDRITVAASHTGAGVTLNIKLKPGDEPFFVTEVSGSVQRRLADAASDVILEMAGKFPEVAEKVEAGVDFCVSIFLWREEGKEE